MFAICTGGKLDWNEKSSRWSTRTSRHSQLQLQEVRTPLMLACSKSHIEIVEKLLQYGAQVGRLNKDGWNSFHIAAREGCVEVLQLLYDQDRRVCKTASKNKRTPMHTAAMHGHLQAVIFLVKHCQYENNLKDTCGSTPLMDALRFGNIDIADYLIKEHKEMLQERDYLGRHCVHLAAQAGQIASIEYLLKNYGIDLNMKTDSNEMVPLHFAAKEGHLDTVQYLIAHGARVNESDNKGRTALHFASAAGKTETVKGLLDFYHVKDLPDLFGMTAQAMAIKSEIKAMFL